MFCATQLTNTDAYLVYKYKDNTFIPADVYLKEIDAIGEVAYGNKVSANMGDGFEFKYCPVSIIL